MQKTSGPELPQTTLPPPRRQQSTSTSHEPRTVAIIYFLSSFCYANCRLLRSGYIGTTHPVRQPWSDDRLLPSRYL